MACLLMVSSITANHRVLQSYLGNNPRVDSAALPATQPVGMAAEQNSTESVQVNVSLAARAKQALKTSFTSYQQQQAETKKAKARERVAEVKKRIDELKRLLTLFGAMAPKALLRELQQLAGELKSAAKELKEGWGSSPTGGANAENVLDTDAAAPEITDDSLNFAAADEQADEQLNEGAPDETRAQPQAPAEDLAADAEDDGSRESAPAAASTTESTTESTAGLTSFLQHTEKEQSKQQRQEDLRLLQETVQELKMLFNRLKAMLRQEDRDKETEKQLEKISQQLTDTNNIASELTLGIEASVPTVNIAV